MSKKLLLVLIATIFVLSLIADGTNTHVGAPVVTALPFTDTGDLIDNTDDNADRYRDEWWEMTPTINLTNVDIHPLYNGWDGYLFVYDANLVQLAFDDDGPGGTADSQIIMDMTAGQTYYIVVDEYSSSTDARTFTLNISADQTGPITDEDAPELISNVNPADGATDVALLPTLTWDFGADTETYDVYFDTVFPPVNQVVTGAASGTTGSYTPAADLVEFTTYYWRVVCHNSITTTETVNSMSFTTVDMSAGHIENADPANSALNVPLDQVITWDFAANAETYDFYFDTVDPPVNQIVTDAAVTGPGSYTPTGLQTATTYYWKVVSKNSTSLRDTEDLMSFQTTLGTDVLTIGNGTEINHHLPIEPYYGYSYSQTIYLQSEINTPGRRIEKVYYQYNNGGTLNNSTEWVLYMGHTANSSFAGNDDWTPVAQLTEVYNGSLPAIPADGWIEFVLTTPFVYNNTDNLIIAVEENQPAYGSSSEEFFGTAVTDPRSIYYYSDSTNPDPVTPPTASNTPSVIPNTRLYFGDIPAGAQMMINPENHDFGTLYTNTASAPITISMQNTGSGVLNVQSVVLDDTANYTLTDNNTYPLTLNTAESATFTVTFNPVNDGPLPATITVTDDITRQTYTINLTGEGFNNTVSVFPYTQNFDSGADLPIGWEQGTEDENDWSVGTSTPSTNTGPQAGDHTSGAGNFVFTEASGNLNQRFDLLAPPVDITTLANPFCSFWYHMLGESMGTLHVDIWDGTQWNEDVMTPITGNQGDSWLAMDIPLAGFGDIVQVRFRGVTGDNYYSDIAIDDISFWDNGTAPGVATFVAPTDGETGVAMTAALEWSFVMGAAGYYVSLGTDNPPTDIFNQEDVTGATTLNYSGLTAGTTYYWQVIPYNAIGNAPNAPIWSFTTFNDLPLPATLVAPADGEQSVIETPTLTWADGGQFPDGYRLYLGTDNPPTDTINGDDMGTATSYDVTTALQFETTYYWQVIPYNFVGDAVSCPTWSFTTNSNQNYGGDGTLYGGYYFANSTPSGNGLGHQPIFEWVDITATGSIPTYTSADDGYATVPIGFTFNYFGNDYTDISLGTNGSVMFSNPTGSTSGSMSIPDAGTPNDVIAIIAQDLHTANVPSNCYYGLDDMGNFVYTVEMWNDYSDASEYMDTQLILYPTGRIKIQYRNYVNPNGDTGTSSILGDACIGIENADGTVGHQYRNNGVGGPLNDPMALCYALNPGDLSDGGNGLFLPVDIEFDVVTVGNNSDIFELRMRNFTDTTIVVTDQPVLSGDNADQFTMNDNNTYPLSIAGGTEATMDIMFTPTSVGHKTAMLTIIDNYIPDDRNTYEITMHGYGYVPDSNDTSDEAHEFALYIENVEGYLEIIEPVTDVDWYVFWQTGPAQLDIHTELEEGSSTDLSAFLYGPYDDVDLTFDEFASIAFDDDSWTDGVSPHLVYDVPDEAASGFYYLRIARSDNAPATRSMRSSSNTLASQENTFSSKLNKSEPIEEETVNHTLPTTRWDTGDYSLWISTDNPVEPSGFDPASNLTANITYQGIDLAWDAPVPATRQLEGYNVYRDDVVINTEPVQAQFYLDTEPVVDQTYEYKITALYSAPAGESAPCDSIMVTYIGVDPPIIAETFESYADFATEMMYWTLADLDGEDTYGFNNGIDFPGENDPMSFVIFNPNSTTPPLQFADAFSGDKYGACFAADSGSNDDWMITPRIQLTDVEAYLDFKARSYTTQFGPELLEVGISMGGTDPSDFTIISGDTPLELPLNWDSYHYNLDAYANELIRVGFHCVSSQTFFMMIDDIMVMNDGATLGDDDQIIIPETTALRGNYPNPFNPETTISFDLKANSAVTIDVYNIKGQRVNRIVEGDYKAGRHTIVWNGEDNNGSQVSSGVYFYKMQSGTYTKTKKMILMK